MRSIFVNKFRIMKKYRNKLFTAVLVILAAVSFTSCTNDNEYWISTTLDFETNIPVMTNGRFDQTIRVDESFIKDFRPSREDLLDIKTFNSWLVISNMLREDRVTLSLVANGNIRYDFRDVISPDSKGEYYIEDNGFYNFMIDVVDVIRARGYVDIKIFGTSNIEDGGPLVFTFENNIDLYIRDK
jgi:hypothetical protein